MLCDFVYLYPIVVTACALNTECLGHGIIILRAKCNSCVVFLDRFKKKIIGLYNTQHACHVCYTIHAVQVSYYVAETLK